MSFIRILILGALLSAIGCSGPSLSVSGAYRTEVSQAGGKTVDVGELVLHPSGKLIGKIGQLEISGKWTKSGSRVFFSSSDHVSDMLPREYRVDGGALIAQYEGVDLSSWRFVKKDSQAVANRID